jgi:hypothetical protein
MKKTLAPWVLCPLLVVGAGCVAAERSANVLAPTVAGPIPGVAITTPEPVTPGQGSHIAVAAQPVTLEVGNVTTSGARPVTYAFEVAADADFGNVILRREGIEPGEDGRTRLRLPDPLAAERSYFWRARAEDGANQSEYSYPVVFTIFTPIVIGRPSLVAPGGSISDTSPRFEIGNAPRSGPAGQIFYTVELASDEAFVHKLAIWTVQEQPNRTTLSPGGLPGGQQFFWRAQASDPTVSGPWSDTKSFRLPAPIFGPAPAPGSGGGSNPNSCNSSSGDDIAECIEARYPGYLAAGVSLSQRVANMQFLRNRMIEHANCRGLDVGLNLKRGGPSISNDFVAWKTNGRVQGVDIASSYDDTRKQLNLMWHTYGPPNYGFPYYKDYGRVSCN